MPDLDKVRCTSSDGIKLVSIIKKILNSVNDFQAALMSQFKELQENLLHRVENMEATINALTKENSEHKRKTESLET